LETALLLATGISNREQVPGNTGGKSGSQGTFSKLLSQFAKSASAPADNQAKISDAQPEKKSDPTDNTAAQALLTALLQQLLGQSPENATALLSASTGASTGDTVSLTGAPCALVKLLQSFASAVPLAQGLIEASGTGDKAAPDTTLFPGTTNIATGNMPTNVFAKTPEPVLKQPDLMTTTSSDGPGTSPTPGDASQLFALGAPAQARQTPGATGQLFQKAQAQTSSLFTLEKTVVAKAPQGDPQATRTSDQAATIFSVQPILAQHTFSPAGAVVSTAGAAGDGTLASKVIGQIVDNAQLVLKGANPSMSIQLKPEFLGDLKLVVEVEHGIVNARFVAQNQATANLIAARLPELRQALNDQGVSWQHLSVSCNAGQGNSQGASDQSQQQTGQSPLQFAAGYDGGAGIDEPQTPQSYQWTGTGALNCII